MRIDELTTDYSLRYEIHFSEKLHQYYIAQQNSWRNWRKKYSPCSNKEFSNIHFIRFHAWFHLASIKTVIPVCVLSVVKSSHVVLRSVSSQSLTHIAGILIPNLNQYQHHLSKKKIFSVYFWHLKPKHISAIFKLFILKILHIKKKIII